MDTNHTDAKILLYDVESSPHTCYTWGVWQQNIAPKQIIRHGQVIMWAAKWYGKKKIMSMNDIDHGHKTMIKGLWDLLDEAEIVVGQNSMGFDNKYAATEFLKYEMPPPSGFRNVDTLKVLRKNFRFPSNKLDAVGVGLKLGGKLSIRDSRCGLDG